jgi:hypothetical protein
VVLGLLPVLVACAHRAPLAVGLAADEPAGIDSFATTTGSRPAVYEWYQDWASAPDFDATRASAAAARGALPVLTWEPWAAGSGAQQPRYALARIADGEYDAAITGFARQVRDWGGRLGLRFLHELNAPFYPWGAGVNGNSPADAVAAWRHVRSIFDQVGAHGVVWIWCVNVQAPGYADYSSLYPGDDAVDWVALDGYNGGTALPWGGWRTPAEVFGPSLDELRRLSRHPVAITEVASAEQGGDKAAWIHQLFDLAGEEGVRVLVWFDHDKETDWRVTSSPAAAASMRRELAIPGRLGPPPLPEG